MKEHWEKNLRLRMQGLRKEAPKGFLDEIKKEIVVNDKTIPFSDIWELHDWGRAK